MNGPRGGLRLALAFVLALVAALLLLVVASSVSSSAEGEEIVVRWDAEDRVQVAVALEPTPFNMSLEYIGPRTRVEVEFLPTDLPHSWIVFFWSESELEMGIGFPIIYERGRTYNATMTVVAPARTLNDTYWLTFTVRVQDDHDVSRQERVGVIIEQYADYVLEVWNAPPWTELRAHPGDEVNVAIALYNLGNGDDRFRILTSSSQPSPGWNVEVVNGLDERGRTPFIMSDMERQDPFLFDVRVSIPPDSFAGDGIRISFDAISLFDPYLAKDPLHVDVSALQVYKFRAMAKGLTKMTGRPGDQVTFQLQVENLGNGVDTITIEPMVNRTSCPGFVAVADPGMVSLLPGERSVISYDVKVPSMPSPKEYYLLAQVRSSSPDLPHTLLSFTVVVERFHGVSVTCDAASCSTRPGGLVLFYPVVTNMGNGPDAFSASVGGVPADWTCYVSPETFSTDQDGEVRLQLAVIVPDTMDKAVVGPLYLTLDVRSTRGDANDSLPLEVEVLRVHRVRWEVDPYHDLGRSVNPYATGHVDYTLVLMNTGNCLSRVACTGRSDHPGLGLEIVPSGFAVEFGDQRPVRVRVHLSRDLPPSERSFVITAICIDDPHGFETEVLTRLRIDLVDVSVPPVPVLVGAPGGGEPSMLLGHGTNLAFQLPVFNNGTVPLENVVVRAYDMHERDGVEVQRNFLNVTIPRLGVGERLTLGGGPSSDDDPPLYWFARGPGTHRLEFRVYVDHQSDVTNDVASLTVQVEAPVMSPDTDEAGWSPLVVGTALAALALAAVTALLSLRRRRGR